MPIQRLSAPTLYAAASLIVATGCSGAVQSPQPVLNAGTQSVHRHVLLPDGAARDTGPIGHIAGAGWFKPHLNYTTFVFISDDGYNFVDVFDARTGEQVGQITAVNGPDGLATDAEGNLYENDRGASTIQIFPPYSSNPSKTISNGGYDNIGIAVDPKGNVYVANLMSADGGQGNVIQYAAGSYKPTVLNGGPYSAAFVAVDKKGNIWADGNDEYGSSMIGYWTNANSRFTAVDIGFKFPGGIAFDGDDNLVLCDQSGSSNGGSELFVYRPGSTKPSRTIVVQNDGSDVVGFALGSAYGRVFAPDVTNGAIYVYGYFSGKYQADFVSDPIGRAIGAAVVPVR